VSASVSASDDPIVKLGAAREIALLRERVAEWLEGVDAELRAPLASAFAGTPKSFRPLTLFAAHRAVHDTRPPVAAVRLAFAVELVHNMSLIVDDVLDGSELRRGAATHRRRIRRARR
jgi:geranylgeranyl pyrophosphate synthase